MNWTFDGAVDALYIHLADGEIDHQVEAGPGCVLDIAADRVLVGIELLSGARLPREIVDEYQITDLQRKYISLVLMAVKSDALLGAEVEADDLTSGELLPA